MKGISYRNIDFSSFPKVRLFLIIFKWKKPVSVFDTLDINVLLILSTMEAKQEVISPAFYNYYLDRSSIVSS